MLSTAGLLLTLGQGPPGCEILLGLVSLLSSAVGIHLISFPLNNPPHRSSPSTGPITINPTPDDFLLTIRFL